MELTELCKEINNWFDVKRHFGVFTIKNGSLKNVEELGLLENQYFRIVGSIFNDGVHQFGTNDSLTDETFEGAVWAMAVPPQVIALLDEMNAWEQKYGEVFQSPYQSESFAGYSYSKAAGTSSDGAGNASGGVLAVFANKLKHWRKV